MKKYIGCALLSLALLGVALLGAAASSRWYPEKPGEPPLSFLVPSAGGGESVSCWTEDGRQYYVFLPSYAELERVRAQVEGTAEVYLNGERLEDGTDCAGLALRRSYPLRIGNRSCSLEFLQSANVAALHIRTASGNMDYIHKNKENRERIAMTAYTPDGGIDYRSAGGDTMNGRGNSTWKYPKKPYNIHLDQPEELLGMAAGEKWCLLTNSSDASNLRNWLVYDMAGRVGFSWTPAVRFADLYLNGEYAGLYLLVEAIAVGENRVDISERGYLFNLEVKSRVNFAKDPAFLTDLSLAVEVGYPSLPDEEQLEEISGCVGSMERALVSPEGIDPVTGRFWEDLIDLDSWARKYLIEEISENFDGGVTSQYFYVDFDGEELPRVAAGPVWDYDLTFANIRRSTNANPRCFYVAQPLIRVHPAPWYAALCRKDAFDARVRELYRQEFLPLLEEYLRSGVDEKAREISDASAMNHVRWGALPPLSSWESSAASLSLDPSGQPLPEDSREESTGRIKEFLAQRMDFLTSAWVDGVDYCSVLVGTYDDAIHATDVYRYYAVVRGERWEEIPTHEELALEGPAWYVAETGEVFDPGAPVTSDLLLMAPRKLGAVRKLAELAKKALKVGPALVLALSLGVFLLIDRSRTRGR